MIGRYIKTLESRAMSRDYEKKLRVPLSIGEMANHFQFHPKIATILHQRGLTEDEELKEYLLGGLSWLHDPQSIPGIEVMKRIIKDRAVNGAQMAIYCDYDVDGLTGAVLLYKVLGQLTKTPPILRPAHRFNDDYGLSGCTS